VIEASGYLYDLEVHKLSILALVGALVDFYWIISEIWDLPGHGLIIDVSVPELSVVSTAEGVEVPVLTND
jgi:hypothetical protein